MAGRLALNDRQKGDVGELAAALELAWKGWMVDMPRRGARDIDLYAYSPEGGRTCSVQVKARASGDFHLGDGLTRLVDATADAWVVLVTLCPPPERCGFCVVPRNHVSAATLAFQRAMEAEGKSWPRKLLGPQEFANYDDWDPMAQHASEAPWRMLAWVVDLLRRVEHRDVLDRVPVLCAALGAAEHQA